MITLSAPAEYKHLASIPNGLKDICNGCGAKNSIIPIPDTFYGLDISEGCNIHDFRYYMGETWSDKDFADDEFLMNLETIIDWAYGETEKEYAESWSIIRVPRMKFAKVIQSLRKVRASEYVLAVKVAGDSAYKEGKGNKPLWRK